MTGRARGGGQLRELLQQLGANDTPEIDVQGIGQALLSMAVEHDPVTQTLVEFLPEEIAQLAHVALVARQVCLRHLTGLAKANGKNDVLGAGTTSRLVSSPMDERFKR